MARNPRSRSSSPRSTGTSELIDMNPICIVQIVRRYRRPGFCNLHRHTNQGEEMGSFGAIGRGMVLVTVCAAAAGAFPSQTGSQEDPLQQFQHALEAYVALHDR